MKLSTRDLKKAEAQAQANADESGQPRWLFMYNSAFWISKTPVKVMGYCKKFEPENVGCDVCPHKGEAVDEMNRKRGVCSNCGESVRKGECRCDDSCHQTKNAKAIAVLKKQVCQDCINKVADEFEDRDGWGRGEREGDELRWKGGKVLCPVFEGFVTETHLRQTTQEPPNWCPYKESHQ